MIFTISTQKIIMRIITAREKKLFVVHKYSRKQYDIIEPCFRENYIELYSVLS